MIVLLVCVLAGLVIAGLVIGLDALAGRVIDARRHARAEVAAVDRWRAGGAGD